MEIGWPQSLLTYQPDGVTGLGELVFNVLTGEATGLALSGTGNAVWPSGMPDGNGYLLQNVSGMDGAELRNPYDHVPHAPGAIVHRARRKAKIITVEGYIVATSPANRQLLVDGLLGVLNGALQVDARYFFKPPDPPGGGGPGPNTLTRFQTVRLYQAPSVVGPSAGAGGSPAGIAGPKTFSFTLIAADPAAYTYTQTVLTIPTNGTLYIPNNGNTRSWPVFQVSPPGPDWIIQDETYGWLIHVLGAPYSSGSDYAEVNMINETIYLNGHLADILPWLDVASSDFFSIPPGGATISMTGADATVLLNDAWV